MKVHTIMTLKLDFDSIYVSTVNMFPDRSNEFGDTGIVVVFKMQLMLMQT